jgi:hypothetical protein
MMTGNDGYYNFFQNLVPALPKIEFEYGYGLVCGRPKQIKYKITH